MKTLVREDGHRVPLVLAHHLAGHPSSLNCALGSDDTQDTPPSATDWTPQRNEDRLQSKRVSPSTLNI